MNTTMSRAAGTLITTNNATYIPPRFMPGYRGYCPTMKYDYGETYGNATSKYFQDYRSSVLNSSASNYSSGGSFPTYYTHNPDLVISNRCRNRDRWLLAPKYELSNMDHDRTQQLKRLDMLSQKHREYYKDKSGTLKSVDYFKLPVSAEDQFRTKDVLMISTYRKPGKLEVDADFDIFKNKRGLPVDRVYDRLIKYHHVY